MSYPTRSELEGENAGYPQFSDIHEYPNPKQFMNNYGKTKPKQKQKLPKPNNYNYNPKQYPKQKVKPKKQNNQQKQFHKEGNVYRSQGGQAYVPVPVGKPKLVPMKVTRYQAVQVPQAPPQVAYYPAQPMPMYAQPAYPYYAPPPPPPPRTVVVIPPGYTADYSPGYSPWGDIADDFDNLF